MTLRKCFLIYASMLFIGVSFLSCSKKKDYSEIENILNRWAVSIKYLNYADYSKLEAFPKDINTFKTMYQDYYIANIKVVEVDNVLHNGTDSDGIPFEFKNVRFVAWLIDRQTNSNQQIVNGAIKLIRYKSGPKKEKGWLLSNRTFIYEK